MGTDNDKLMKLDAVIFCIVNSLADHLNRTKIVKMCFLIDLKYKKKYGRTITGIDYKYLLYGPYSDEIINSIQFMNGFEICETENFDGSYSYSKGENPLLNPNDLLSDTELEVISEVIDEFGYESLKSLLKYVYNLDTMKKHQKLEIVLQ